MPVVIEAIMYGIPGFALTSCMLPMIVAFFKHYVGHRPTLACPPCVRSKRTRSCRNRPYKFAICTHYVGRCVSRNNACVKISSACGRITLGKTGRKGDRVACFAMISVPHPARYATRDVELCLHWSNKIEALLLLVEKTMTRYTPSTPILTD